MWYEHEKEENKERILLAYAMKGWFDDTGDLSVEVPVEDLVSIIELSDEIRKIQYTNTKDGMVRTGFDETKERKKEDRDAF